MSATFVSSDPIRLKTISHVRCRQCRSALTLHQPDEELPERLLATCGRCKSWYLIDGEAGLMVPLPDEWSLRNI